MADLAEFMPANFVDWGPEAHGEGLTREWVGIMASSRDGLPLVGAVPGMEGVSIAAGVSFFLYDFWLTTVLGTRHVADLRDRPRTCAHFANWRVG